MLEKRFWILSTYDYFRSKVFFYSKNVFLYSRSVFMYLKKCLFILTLYFFILLTNYELEQQNDKHNSTFIFIQKLNYVIVSVFILKRLSQNQFSFFKIRRSTFSCNKLSFILYIFLSSDILTSFANTLTLSSVILTSLFD
jgi:membrane-associated HD superfamily phosphohydrolase